MGLLSEADKNLFEKQGYLLYENAVTEELLRDLQSQFNDWVEQSRDYNKAYGDTVDGRPRFDLEPGHTSARPALRRVNSPVEVSGAYYQAMAESSVPEIVAELIGPNIKYHHSKINSKLPSGTTEVKWHQDFPFTPHSNDDLITALLLVDEVTEENGPLQVVPGSHQGELHELWHDGVFTGAVSDQVTEYCLQNAETCIGPAGSVCLMHTRLLHGSSTNRSEKPRTLFITVYSAEDAVPCSPNPVPSRYEGAVVRGEATSQIRSTPYKIKLPQPPTTASFFDQQAGTLDA